MINTPNEFTGLWTASVTPFNADGKIDIPAMKDHMEYSHENGVEVYLLWGSTGSDAMVTDKEQFEVGSELVKHNRGRMLTVMGTGANATHEARRRQKLAHEVGVDGALTIDPYKVKPTQEGHFLHNQALAAAAPIPTFLYAIQGRTGTKMTPETFERVAKLPNIAGIKDAMGDPDYTKELFARRPENFLIASGDDGDAIRLIKQGNGELTTLVSVLSNVIPGHVKKMVDEAKSGQYEQANETLEEATGIIKMLFTENNPIGIKSLMSILGWIEEAFRLPNCPMSPENKQKMQELRESHALLKGLDNYRGRYATILY